MIWASRHFQKSNPQNLMRPSDLMRILVPWRAFGDLEQARTLVESHAAQLIHGVEANRDQRLADIEDAFGPVLAPLTDIMAKHAELDGLDLRVATVNKAIHPDHKWFGPLAPLKAEVEKIQAQIKAVGRGDKAALKAGLAKPKKAFEDARKQLIAAMKKHLKQLNKAIRELNKLQVTRDTREREIRLAADREIVHLNEAADDLRRILNDPDEARRYFAVVDRAEIEENEFNLNLPRYVDTFEPKTVVPLETAIASLSKASRAVSEAQAALQKKLNAMTSISADKD
jgi:type I restriction enzyme M protein